jgi:alpha-L-fucosidase
VNAAGRNANFLLNIGPMPNGEVQTEFTDTLKGMGIWLNKYGESVYGTRGKIIEPQDWGVVTGKDKKLFVHVLHPKGLSYIFLPGIKDKVLNAVTMMDNKTVTFKQQPEGLFIYTNGISFNDTDTIVQLQVQ